MVLGTELSGSVEASRGGRNLALTRLGMAASWVNCFGMFLNGCFIGGTNVFARAAFYHPDVINALVEGIILSVLSTPVGYLPYFFALLVARRESFVAKALFCIFSGLFWALAYVYFQKLFAGATISSNYDNSRNRVVDYDRFVDEEACSESVVIIFPGPLMRAQMVFGKVAEGVRFYALRWARD
jgi:hypothetical protein